MTSNLPSPYAPPPARARATFTIPRFDPVISITPDKSQFFSCERLSGTITAISNDPQPNGGTIDVFANGTLVDSYTFTGKQVSLRFADLAGFMRAAAQWGGSPIRLMARITTAAGYTATASATVAVVPGGLAVQVVPARTMVYPWINNRRAPWFGDLYTTPVDVHVSCAGAPVAGALVQLRVRLAPGSETLGGHDHGARNGAAKPAGTLDAASGVTNAQGVFSTIYRASEYAGKDEVAATASYAGVQAQNAAVITVRVPGLVPISLPPGSPHQLIGGTCAHYGAPTPWAPGKLAACGGVTGNHNTYLKPGALASLMDFLSSYAATFGAGLYINDASLPWGGRFDIRGDWCTRGMPCAHQTHRTGVDVDLALKDTSAPATARPTDFPVVWKKVLRLYRDTGRLSRRRGGVKRFETPKIIFELHGAGRPSAHIHIYFPQ